MQRVHFFHVLQQLMNCHCNHGIQQGHTCLSQLGYSSLKCSSLICQLEASPLCFLLRHGGGTPTTKAIDSVHPQALSTEHFHGFHDALYSQQITIHGPGPCIIVASSHNTLASYVCVLLSITQGLYSEVMPKMSLGNFHITLNQPRTNNCVQSLHMSYIYRAIFVHDFCLLKEYPWRPKVKLLSTYYYCLTQHYSSIL